jgi:ubiquitin carboxyl-terminal hydrolase L5
MSEWNTIESDAGVFTELIERLGVEGAEFEELLSLDSDSLRQIHPLYGVIFLFKYRRSESANGPKERPIDGAYDEDGAVFFAHQKIQNACATQAVLSLILNNDKFLSIGEELKEFKEFVEAFDADLKGETISNSDTIRTVHNSFSRPNPFVDDSDQPPVDEDDDGLYHFIAYVPFGGKLYELDGLHPYPISHGECNAEDFYVKLPEVLSKRISRAPEGEMRFNLLALTQDKRILLNASGDTAGLVQEELKRQGWRRENSLRRENFIGLIYEVMRGIARKCSNEEWKSVIERGRAESRRQLEARQTRNDYN